VVMVGFGLVSWVILGMSDMGWFVIDGSMLSRVIFLGLFLSQCEDRVFMS